MSSPDAAGLVKMLEALADLPGSALIEIYTRRLPRFWPAEHRSHYEEKQASVKSEDVARSPPENLVVSNHPDEMVITVRGSVGMENLAGKMKEATSTLLGALSLENSWDWRVQIKNDDPEAQEYELKLSSRFTAFPRD